MILRAAERRPQILVIEDLHWLDRATEEFLAVLGDSVPASPVLLIFTYRPGYAQPFGERTYHTRIIPALLSEPESARMAAAILSSDALPDTLRSALAAKAEGNPFYVEEVVRSLHEAGAIRVENGRFVLTARPDDVVIPDTIPRRDHGAHRPAGRGTETHAADRLRHWGGTSRSASSSA